MGAAVMAARAADGQSRQRGRHQTTAALDERLVVLVQGDIAAQARRGAAAASGTRAAPWRTARSTPAGATPLP
eukprot:scaffold24322_cov81-Phaeocystis_antarctica.AAC.6